MSKDSKRRRRSSKIFLDPSQLQLPFECERHIRALAIYCGNREAEMAALRSARKDLESCPPPSKEANA